MAGIDFTEASTRATLKAVCGIAGFDGTGAELIRIGTHAVYRLAEPVVVRISRGSSGMGSRRREIRVAHWLESIEFPAVRAVRGVDQLVKADGRVATFWHAIERASRGTARDLAWLLKRLHALRPSNSLDLREVEPFAEIRKRLAEFDGPDRGFLLDRAEELDRAYDNVYSALPEGLIHGDASPASVLTNGQPVLIGLDHVAIGPREWDLVPTATYYDSFGWIEKEDYDAFVATYGFDVTTRRAFATLRQIRELLMIARLSQQAPGSAELAMRISTVREGQRRKAWTPY
jgi:hypothetical protein